MKIIGHRGALALAHENTIASIKQAMHYAVDEIEFDVRVTADGVPVLHHNSFVAGVRGGRYFIGRHNYKTLLKRRPDLTTLEEVLLLTKNKASLYIEVKPGSPTQPITAVIRKYIADGGKPELLAFASYSQKVLLALHADLPAIQTVVIDNWSGIRATRRARQLGTKRLSMNQRWLWAGYIRRMSKNGWKISAFTVNDPAKADAWFKLGLYAAITDSPDRFKK